MKYEVRYIVNAEEHVEAVDVATAAEAVETVKNQHPDPDQNFELIQVQLLEDPSPESSEVATGA